MSLPQADVLGHAAAVVCHRGSGTTLGSLAVRSAARRVPLFADQAWRVADEMRRLPPVDNFVRGYSDDHGSRKSA